MVDALRKTFLTASVSFGVPGVRYLPSFLTVVEADALLARALADIAWRPERLLLFGREVVAPRRSAWLGEVGASYRYSGATRRAAAWPPFVKRLAARVGATVGSRFNYALVNRYRDGRDMLGWHADDEPDLGPAPVIATVSIGAERVLRLRPRRRELPAARRSVGCVLRHGSLLVMWGDSQRDHQHCVPRTAKPVGERVSFTFRRTNAVAARG